MIGRRNRLEVTIDGESRGAVSAARDTSRAYRGLDRDLDRVDGSSRRASGGMGGLAGGLRKAAGVATLAGAGLAAAGAGAWQLFQQATDAAEASAAVAEIYGSSFSTIEAAAGDAARAVGLSRTEYLDAAKTMGVFGGAAGLAESDLADFSTGLITAAADLASFNNATPQEAIEAIGSALRGEAEPLRRFGILMDDATLRNEALKMGLISTTKEALTPQQKTLAAQALVMNNLGAAQGDWARTSDAAANQQRILTAQVKDLAAELGANLLPAGTAILTWLNEQVPKLREMFAVFQGGIPSLTGTSAAAGALSGQLTPLQSVLAAVRTAADFVRTTFESKARTVRNIVTPALDGLRKGADTVRAALARNPEVAAFLRESLTRLGKVFTQVQKSTETASRVIGPVLGGAIRVAGSAIAGLIDFAGSLVRAFNRARDAVTSAARAIRTAISGVRDRLSSVPLIGRFLGSAGPVLTTAAAAPAPAGLATAATGSAAALLGITGARASTAGGITYALTVRVDGALDPVAVANQIRDIVRADMRRTGRSFP